MDSEYEQRFAEIRDKLTPGLKGHLLKGSSAEWTVPAFGQWAVASVPARLDFCGGWSDTPPIAYEHGGVVVTAAIQIDGKRPILAACRRIPQPVIQLASTALGSTGQISQALEIKSTSDLAKYSDPSAPCSLLSAVVVAMNVADPSLSTSLETQLAALWEDPSSGVGLEIRTDVDLPVGSGLGTSSILIAAVVASVGAILGRPFHLDVEGLDRIVHGTLYVEQLLSTGGGWQDQIGGIYPGLKISRSQDRLPLVVQTGILQAAPWILEELSDRLILVFTGQQRLAKNLLRDVINGFWTDKGPGQDAQEAASGQDYPPTVRAALRELVARAERCGACLSEGYWQGFANAVDRYWTLKKYLANPTIAEPEPVKRLIARLKQPDLGFLAASFAGAGGGGFLYAIGSDKWDFDTVSKAVMDCVPEARVYCAAIDTEGLTIEISDKSIPFQ